MSKTRQKEDKRDKEVANEENYKILYEAYADEIKNLWQRSVFLGAFMVLVWTGYGALQLKIIEKSLEIENLACTTLNLNVYHIVSFGLCFIIIALSLLWIAMAKGSKFVQEAHEWHISKNNQVQIDGNTRNLFCNLKGYEFFNKNDGKTDEINNNLYANFIFKGALRAYRYSPSKINIALGWFSAMVAILLSVVHIVILCINKSYWYCALVLVVILILYPLSYFIKKHTKGGNKDKKLSLWTIQI